MSSKLLKIGTLFLAGVLASAGAAAHADQINTSGSVCHYVQAGQADDFGYTANAIFNNSTASRQVVCPVPRPPLSSVLETGTFFVDGHNDPNTSTTCTVYVLDFLGNVVTSNTFSESAPIAPPGDASGREWDHEVDFPGVFLTTFDYVSVLCTIPGNRDARIRGVTAVAP